MFAYVGRNRTVERVLVPKTVWAMACACYDTHAGESTVRTRHVGACGYKKPVDKRRRRRHQDLSYTWRLSRGRPTQAEITYAWRLRRLIYAGKNRPCADCNNFYAQGFGDRLTYDHLPGTKKDFDVGAVGVSVNGEIGHRLVSVDALLAEIRKCEVVCLGCHRKREDERNREWQRLIDGAPLAARMFAILAEGAQVTESAAAGVSATFDVLIAAGRKAKEKTGVTLGGMISAMDLFGRVSARAYEKATSPEKLSRSQRKTRSKRGKGARQALLNLERYESSTILGCLQQAKVLAKPVEVLAELTRAVSGR